MNASAPQLTATSAASAALVDPNVDKEGHLHDNDVPAIMPTLGHQGQSADGHSTDAEKQIGDSASSQHSQYDDDKRPNEEAQNGVQVAEAITLTWTRPWLIAAYAA